MMKTDDYNDQSVTEEKLKDGAITTRKIADGSVTKDKLDSSIRQEINESVTASNEATEKAKEATAKADQATEKAKQATAAATAAKEAADTATQLATNATTASVQATEQAKAATTKAEESAAKANEAAQKADDSREQTEQTLGTMQEVVDKVAIKDEEGALVETPFRYIQNEEFIFAKVDAEDKLLFGIQCDGTPKFGKTSAVEDRLQSQVTLLAERVATIMGDDDTTNVIDTMNELKKFFAEIENTETLTGILANLDNVAKNLDKTTIKDEEGVVQDTPFKVIENEEFIMSVVDSEDKVLFGIYRATGKPYYPQNDMYHISQSEEFLWVILDAANHPLLGIQQDGTCWAAKAQWLDDIKAIKEAFKTFQPKEDGKGLINLDVADSLFYISNDEYIIAVVDAENRILAGIKYDGEPYFPNHEMYSVITNEEWFYAIIDAENKVLGGFRADDGHMIVGSIDISTFISNAIIDISDIKERTAHLSTTENDEYLSVETDADGKILGYTTPDGSHYLYKVKSETIDAKVDKEKGKSLIDADVADAHYTIEDHEGRTEITTDADDKLLGYREEDGTRYEHKQKVENMSVNHFSNLSETACQDIINSLSAYGLTLENKLDFSDNIDIFIPIPRGVAVVNIIADSLATSKTQNKDAVLEFWGSGIYFRKNIILNAQGQTSMAFAKKNQSFDFKDGTSIKFGDWVSQDSFHLKANADDVFCGLNNVVYKYADYVVGKTDTRANRVLRSATTSYQNASGKFKADFDDNAKCMPDGFPISLHLNGEFYGMYTWNMKKHRANYSMDKKDYTSIMIDPDRLTSDTFWNGTIDWSKFELKNPKTLICMDGSKYDGDNPKELIDSTSEKYDESNKDMKNTAITKSLLVSLSNAMPAINALSSEEEKKAKFKELFDYDNLVVYFLVSNAIGNYDGLWGRNTVFTIYNSGKCGFNFYDCNAVFGREARGWYSIKPNEIEKAAGTPFEMLDVLFHTEIANEYAKLRTGNLISTDTICTFLQDWLSTIGAYSISRNLDKWNEIPSYRDGSKTYPSYPTTNGFYDSFQRCEKWVKERISFMDNYFNYNV